MIVIDIPSLLTTPIKLSSPWHCNFCFEKIFRQVYKFSAEQLGLLLNRADSTCIHNSSSTVPFLDFQGNLLLLHRIGNMEYFVLANICFCKAVYHTKGLEFYKYSVQYLVGWTKGMYANFARSLWSINTEIAGSLRLLMKPARFKLNAKTALAAPSISSLLAKSISSPSKSISSKTQYISSESISYFYSKLPAACACLWSRQDLS